MLDFISNFKIRCNNQSFISWFNKTNYRKHHILKSVFDEFLTAIKKRVAITLPSICLSSSTHKPYPNCQLTVDCYKPCNSEID
nr:MAG TPA: hypothetical protein [Caudoviricetes sp.]